MCVRIYMFICSELIEETGRLPGMIFGMWISFFSKFCTIMMTYYFDDELAYLRFGVANLFLS